MSVLLADVNIEGHLHLLLSLLASPGWASISALVEIQVRTFPHLGLAIDAPDSVIWRACQQHGVLLVTANRNMDGADSLEATIRACHSPEVLPVLTLANPARILRDRDYAEQTAARLLEVLFDLDQFRGVGRVFLP